MLYVGKSSLIYVCCLQAVEGVILLPDNEDLSQIGVKSKDLHFITAGSKGSPVELSRTSNLCCSALVQILCALLTSLSLNLFSIPHL